MFGPAPLEDILCIQKGRQTGRNNSSGQLMCYENRTPLRAVDTVSTAANVTPAVYPAGGDIQMLMRQILSPSVYLLASCCSALGIALRHRSWLSPASP